MSNIMEDKKSSISNIIDALTKIENNHLNFSYIFIILYFILNVNFPN